MRSGLKIIYLTNARLPTEKAHGLATVKLCEAFAAQGAEVMIVAPRRKNPIRQDLFEYYRAKKTFAVHYLPSIDFLRLGFGQRLFFPLELLSFSIIAALWLWLRYSFWVKRNDAVILSHDHVPLFFASLVVPHIFYDIHDYPGRSFFYRRVMARAKGFGVQTKWKISKLKENFGLHESKIVYWPNGTDIARFDIAVSQTEARVKLLLPPDKKIILYTGSLQPWKGAETLAEAARFLPENFLVYIAGNSYSFNISIFKYLNIRLAGQRPWTEIPLWLKAADVLVLPNTGRQNISRYYTSPMKLFEYMASGRPIVASRIPSIREIVNESMVWFAEPDNPRSFANSILKVLGDSREAQRRAQRAREEAAKYSWDARAGKVLAFIRRLQF